MAFDVLDYSLRLIKYDLIKNFQENKAKKIFNKINKHFNKIKKELNVND